MLTHFGVPIQLPTSVAVPSSMSITSPFGQNTQIPVMNDITAKILNNSVNNTNKLQQTVYGNMSPI